MMVVILKVLHQYPEDSKQEGGRLLAQLGPKDLHIGTYVKCQHHIYDCTGLEL